MNIYALISRNPAYYIFEKYLNQHTFSVTVIPDIGSVVRHYNIVFFKHLGRRHIYKEIKL